MSKINSVVFLHLSDIHLRNERDISDKHIQKIVDSIKGYKNVCFDNIVIVLSGDIAQSGLKSQYSNGKKLIGSLIKGLKDTFNCWCTILLVPGNHDVDHSKGLLQISSLTENKYLELEKSEYEKMSEFYNLAQFNKCFCCGEVFCDIKILEINKIKIKVNLINNGIYSTRGEYKGLLYLPNDYIEKLSDKKGADFVISVMHHAPDYYRDDIKNIIEDKVVKNSDILFHGHEHYNYSKQTSFNGSELTTIQSGGSLCNNGDWSESSYLLGLLDTKTLQYEHYKYTWNNSYEQYEHDVGNVALINREIDLKITDDFLDFIKLDKEEKYYVFPSIIYHGNKSTEDFSIETFDNFEKELLEHECSIIVGSSNIGKTTLLKHIFTSFAKNKYVLYASPEKLLEKSSHKRQNIEKLIKSLFEDIYGSHDSEWQKFEQSNKNNCVFILDDFEQIDGINLNELFRSLGNRFGTIIISSTRIIDFDPLNINIEGKDTIARFEIKAPVGHKRREIIRAVVTDKANDKSEKNIDNIVKQVDRIIKTQLNIIPPEPYYIIQMAESYMNNVGEAIFKSTNAFNKVFEANLTNKIDAALKSKTKNKTITVELMYLLFGKIAYYIHFNKAYPVMRSEIDRIIVDYNEEYGKSLVTEDIIKIAKSAKIISDTEENSEAYRFRNKSILAYFVANEIVSRNDFVGLMDVINKACINICTDILLFVIFLTDDTAILKSILECINRTIESDQSWIEFSIPDAVPHFVKNSKQLPTDDHPVNKNIEKKQIDDSEEKVEEAMIKEFRIKDIYDWDDSVINEFNNKLFKMTSLLQIIAKCLPCFEHLLKKSEKQELIELLYKLPNRIFMFWSGLIEKHYDDIIGELKTHPYFTNKKMRENDIDSKVKASFTLYSMNLLLNLYYIPVLNATGNNTIEFLNNVEFFDFTQNPTYQLEHLMFIEQIQNSSEFISSAINMKKTYTDIVSSYLLQCIVRHGLITRNDNQDDINRLESKFFPKEKKPILIERTKNKHSKK